MTHHQNQHEKDVYMYPFMSKMCATNIVLSVALFACFITIFFFTYVSNVERHMFKEQITLTFRQMFGQLDHVNGGLNMPIPTSGSEVDIDKRMRKVNRRIIMTTVVALLLLCGVSLAILYFLGQITKGNIKWILLRHLIGLVCVVITEVIFIQSVVKNYLFITPNMISSILLKNILSVTNE